MATNTPPSNPRNSLKTSPGSRRYLVPAVFFAAVVASYAFGYVTNILFSDTPPELKAAQALAAAQHAGGAAGADPAAVAAANRIGRSFGDDAPGIGGLTVEKVTGGQPLEAWLKKLMAQDDEAFRLRNFMKLYDALNSVDDVKAALKALGGGNGRGGGRMETSMLLQKLTMLDPKAAIAYATEGRGGERFMAMGTVVRTWAKTDPASALAWAKANGTPKEGSESRGGPGGEGRGPGGPGGNENWMLASVITQIAKTDVDKALTEASTVEGRMGGRMVESLTGEIIQQRGADAARQAAAALPEGNFKNEFIRELAGRLTSQDPKGTASWASNLPAGETKSRALRETVQEWTRKDAASAGAFVSSLPATADSDSARARYAVEVAGKDQSTALATINRITDPERQKRTVGEIAGSIARRDPAAGQQFIAQTSIDAQAKADLARSVARPQRGPGGPGGRGGPGGSRPGPGGQRPSR
jgi:hypothetical protein